MMRFAVNAAKAGIHVRWINLRGEGISFEQLAFHLRKYDGLEDFDRLVLSRDAIWHAYSLDLIPTNSNDMFMGTYYLTALIASASQRLLHKNPNILYFVQDYEAAFFPHGSDFVDVAETYDLPHFAIFSTPMLREYFRVKKLGVYKQNESLGETRSFATLPAIRPFKLG